MANDNATNFIHLESGRKETALIVNARYIVVFVNKKGGTIKIEDNDQVIRLFTHSMFTLIADAGNTFPPIRFDIDPAVAELGIFRY